VTSYAEVYTTPRAIGSVKRREIAKQVPEETRLLLPVVEWRKMAGMRDHLIHHYGDVDYFIVWDVAVNKAAELAAKLRPIVEAAGGQ